MLEYVSSLVKVLAALFVTPVSCLNLSNFRAWTDEVQVDAPSYSFSSIPYFAELLAAADTSPALFYTGLTSLAFFFLSYLVPFLYPSCPSAVPMITGALPYLGHALFFAREVPWTLMTRWHALHGRTYAFVLFSRLCVSTTSLTALKTILHKDHGKFVKDVPFTYAPFIPILGRGIVTSSGRAWRTKRTRVSKVRRRASCEVL